MSSERTAVEVLNVAHQVLENFFDRHKTLQQQRLDDKKSSSVLQYGPAPAVSSTTSADHPGTKALASTANMKLAKDLTSWVAKTVCWGGQQRPQPKASSVLQLQRVQSGGTVVATEPETPTLQDATATEVYCKDKVMKLAYWSRKTFLCASD